MRLVLLAALLASAASAQPALQPAPAAGGPALTLDALYAIGDDIPVTTAESPDPLPDDEIGLTSMALLLGVRMPVGGVTLVGEVPMGYFAVDYPEPTGLGPFGGDVVAPDDAADFGFGNPYLGVEVRPVPAVALSGGVRLPLVSAAGVDTEGWQGGLRAEPERFEVYLPNTLTASLGISVRSALSDQLGASLRLDPALLVPTDDTSNSTDPDLVVGGGLGLELLAGAATLQAGLYGRRVLTGGNYGTAEIFDTDGMVTAGLAVDVGGVRPGLDVRVPLSSSPFGQDATVGLGLDIPLR